MNTTPIATTVAPPSATKGIAAGDSERKRRNEEDAAGLGGVAVLSGSPFATHLSATRVMDPYGRFGQGRTSASQMFEASHTDPAQHRRSAMSEANGQARQQQASARTGVDARAASARDALPHENPVSAGRDGVGGTRSSQSPGAGYRGESGAAGQNAVTVEQSRESAMRSIRADVGSADGTPNVTTSGKNNGMATARGIPAQGVHREQAAASPVPRLSPSADAALTSTKTDGMAGRIARTLAGPSIGQAGGGRGATAQSPVWGADTAASRSSENAESARGSQSARNGRQVAEAKEPQLERAGFDRLVRMMRLRPGVERSSARIHLNPPQLGRILVDVRVDGDALHLDIRTETEEAKAALFTRVQQLRVALEQTGLHVEQFQISKDVAAVLGMKPDEQTADRRDARRVKENSRGLGRVTGGARGATGTTNARDAEAASHEAATQHVRMGVAGERRLDVKV